MNGKEEWTLFGPLEAVVKPKSKKRDEVIKDYDRFISKFNSKAAKTTDDCYTPPAVYDAVVRFVNDNITNLTGRTVVRPFYPGGDYLNYEYPEDCIVIDNPPFSIVTKIARFYSLNSIPFFLFAPGLTLFQVANDCDLTYIVTGYGIIYENGAEVNTGFVTNMVKDYRIWCCPELRRLLVDANSTERRSDNCHRRLSYSENKVSAALLGCIARQCEYKIRKEECARIKRQALQPYGGGFYISDRAAAERAAAAIRIELTPEERLIIEELNRQSHGGE